MTGRPEFARPEYRLALALLVAAVLVFVGAAAWIATFPVSLAV